MVNVNATGFVFISFIIFELYTGAIPSVELKPPKIFPRDNHITSLSMKPIQYKVNFQQLCDITNTKIWINSLEAEWFGRDRFDDLTYIFSHFINCNHIGATNHEFDSCSLPARSVSPD